MPQPQGKPRRGLSDIRTNSDLLTETSNPQRKYLKLAMLSMEEVRRGRERKSASERIQDIDGRLSEIRAEKGILLTRSVGDMEGGTDLADPKESGPAERRRTGTRSGFKFRY